MRVEIGNAALVDELAQALRRCEFRVMRVGSHELEVKLGPAQHGAAEIEGAAELELDLYLKAWEAEHPGARAIRTNRGSRLPTRRRTLGSRGDSGSPSAPHH